jgi:sulfate transport system permease protein
MPRRRVIPGLPLTLGFTSAYLGLVVLIPLAAVFVKSSTLSAHEFWSAVSSPRALSAYRVSFGCSLAAAAVNATFGLLVAWVLARYRFPGRALVDALIDLPFALPTAVAGIALFALYAPDGWLGRFLTPLGLRVIAAPLGITIALTFVGLPFVVRMVEPVLRDLSADVEEAAASLGARRYQTVALVILPQIAPALLAGFALAFARGLGEFGSVVFISGSRRYQSEIVPDMIRELIQSHYVGSNNLAEATAIAAVMLIISLVLLFALNLLQRRLGRTVVRA